MLGFFDKNYRTPLWFKSKLAAHKKRRNFLKSAGGLAALSLMPSGRAFSSEQKADEQQLLQLKQTNPWKTLNAVFEHLLPEDSASQSLGPGAQTLNIYRYAVNVIEHQQIDEQEKSFIFKGVGWLNGFSQQRHQQDFISLSHEQKESTLRGITRSQAGENWINTLLIYVLEGALSPPAYGGNTEQKGWQWLQHRGGFPLPSEGTRFYELPVKRAQVARKSAFVRNSAQQIAVVSITEDDQIGRAAKNKVVKS